MTKEEFDKLKVGDIVTNKTFDDSLNREMGYDYKVIKRTTNSIEVKDLMMGFEYLIEREDIEDCLDFRKK